jgi:hypothetical protein
MRALDRRSPVFTCRMGLMLYGAVAALALGVEPKDLSLVSVVLLADNQDHFRRDLRRPVRHGRRKSACLLVFVVIVAQLVTQSLCLRVVSFWRRCLS